MRRCSSSGDDRGFTLIELMIVVVIIAILAAIAIPKFNEVSKSSKEAEAMPILKQLYTLQERYKQRYEVFATDISDLEGAVASFASAKYYQFEISDGDEAAYLACARPNGVAEVRYFTINEQRVITPASGCN